MDTLLHYLLAPASGMADHAIDPQIAWHGRFMFLAWGILIPLGIVSARYWKVVPGQHWPERLDNPAWWHAHRATQYGGVALGLVGVLLAWRAAGNTDMLRNSHTTLGWIVTALGLAQVASALMRGSKGGPGSLTMRGDHYDMSMHRRRFEVFHKIVGYSAMLLAAATLLLGLAAADAPRWMWLLLTCWWLLLSALCVRWQRQGRAFDTYQAIWGPGAEHPGNRRRPFGFGIRRYTPQTYASSYPRSFL